MDPRGVIKALFGVPRALVGVVHTGGLPGTPAGDRRIDEIVETRRLKHESTRQPASTA